MLLWVVTAPFSEKTLIVSKKIAKTLETKFFVFVAISVILVAAFYSSSGLVVFAANKTTIYKTKFSTVTCVGDNKLQWCGKVPNGVNDVTFWRCTKQSNGKWKCVEQTSESDISAKHKQELISGQGGINTAVNNMSAGLKQAIISSQGGIKTGSNNTTVLQGGAKTGINTGVNNTMPLRLNATSSSNPGAFLKNGGLLKDDGIMTRPQKGLPQGGPINAAPPVSNVVVTVIFDSITVHDRHDTGPFNDGEYDLAAYVQGRKVDLTDASQIGLSGLCAGWGCPSGPPLYDVGDGDTLKFAPDTQIIAELPNTVPLSIFTVGTEVDGCGRGNFPDNIQQTLPIFFDPQLDWLTPIAQFQDKTNSYAHCGGTFTDANDILGIIREFYDPPGYGVGPHEVKSSTGDFTLRYTISKGDACNASTC
jgi:hypothetical protein